MKTPLLTLASLALSLQLVAQGSTGLIEINNVSASVQPTGHLFWDFNESQFNIPANADTRTIFASFLCMGGLDNQGQIHLFADRYGYNGLDVQPGPIMDDTHYASESPNWDKVWSVSRQEIDEFRAWYDAGVQDQLNGTNTQSQLFPGYTIPDAIETWPGSGNLSLGQTFYLAPFLDRNGDGNYHADDGDYPMIRGDHALWFVYNDDKLHLATTGTPFSVQVSVMVYGFDCPSSEALDNTLFAHYEILNLSGNLDYHDVYLSSWVDFDIGNSQDDYIGCDVSRSAMFAFNGDDMDEDVGSITGYGNSPPAQAVIVLDGPLQVADNADNAAGVGSMESINGLGYGDGIADNERLGLTGFMAYSNQPFGPPFPQPTAEPQLPADYYNSMRSRWLDGLPLTHGGNGYDTTAGAIETRFMYPEISNPLGYGVAGNQSLTSWAQGDSILPHDIRGMASMGPFDLEVGHAQTVDLAFVYGREQGGTALQSVDAMKDNIDEIHQIYEDDVTPCGFPFQWTNVAPQPIETDLLQIYPNPATEQVWVDGLKHNQGTNYRIMSITGQLVQSGVLWAENASIDIRELPAGVYLLQVDAATQQHIHKLVKR